MSAEGDTIYAAAASTFGLIVRGSAKRLRDARSELARGDPALADLVVLGPDGAGCIWLARKDAIRRHILTEDE